MKTFLFPNLVLGTLLLLFAPAPSHSGTESRDQAFSLIRKAHADYLEGNFRAVIQTIKRILELPGEKPYIDRNALELFERVRSLLGKTPLPLDWQLPVDCQALELTERRKITGRKKVEILEFSGVIPGGAKIENIRIHKSDLALLDRQANLGDYQELPLADRFGSKRFKMTRHLKEALNPGLYCFEIAIAGAKNIKGWFILGLGSATLQGKREKPARILASEGRLRLYQRALDQKILVLKSQRVESLQSEGGGDRLQSIIHINQQDASYFGDLLIRQVITSEVSFEENEKRNKRKKELENYRNYRNHRNAE